MLEEIACMKNVPSVIQKALEAVSIAMGEHKTELAELKVYLTIESIEQDFKPLIEAPMDKETIEEIKKILPELKNIKKFSLGGGLIAEFLIALVEYKKMQLK